MACFKPLDAWQTDDGKVIFAERGRIRRALRLPCGQCVGCRLERSRVWATRCIHESQLHEFSSFVTLTYDDENCPVSLNYRHFQLFMKRVRKRFGPTRFYMCGEYGEQTFRPHFHACLFGVFFGDRVLHSDSHRLPLYRSDTLDALWGRGFATVGDVTFESAAYCARYVMKKVTGDRAAGHYERVALGTGEIVNLQPEFCRMSLKPGIGGEWFKKYSGDVYGYDRDAVPVNGMKLKPPRYYDKLLAVADPELSEYLELARYERRSNPEESSVERLRVREEVARAGLAFKSRSL